MMFRKSSAIITVLIAALMLVSSVCAFALTPDYASKIKNPLVNLPVDDRTSIKNGTLVMECEDFANPKGIATVVNDAKASNGQVLAMGAIKWYVEDLAHPDLDTKIYLPEDQEEGVYKLWYRARTLTTETASVRWFRTDEIWATTWFSSVQDGNYYWSSTNITLYHGENTLKMQRVGSTYMDKIIITSDLSFKPEGMDDAPVYRTPEEEKEYVYSLYDMPTIKPIEGHPRLYVTKDYIPTLKNNVENGDYSFVYERVKKYAQEDINAKLDTSLANNHNAMLLVKIMSRAFVWMIGEETDINHAKKTYQHMIDYLETVRTPDDEGDITRSRGNYLVSAAIVYDWCYDAVGEAERAHLLELIKKVITTKETGWPPTVGSSLVSHTGEREIFRDYIAAGVAVYDEYPDLYDVSAGRMFEEMVPGRLWLHGTGKPISGNDYGECRWSSEMWADITFQRMGYDSIFGDLNGEPYTWLLYSRMPYGHFMPKGDMYSLTGNRREEYYVNNYPEGLFIAAQLYDDPYIQNEWDRMSQVWDGGEHEKFYMMLFDNPKELDREGEIRDSLPLTLQTTYPQSAIVARTSWQEGYNSDAAMVTLDMHEMFVSDHQEMFTGDFQFYYKGLLAMNTGVYNTNTQHNEGYDRRSIAGNVMLCYDPDETFVPGWSNVIVPNDGGQRNPYVNPETGKSMSASVGTMEEYDIDENGIIQNRSLVVSDDVKQWVGPNKNTPEFSYIGGDLTNAYTDKITDYKRNMVFLNLFNDDYPAALVVFDKMSSSNKTFKKTWLLHSQLEPTIDGNKTIIVRNDSQFDGKLVNQTLLPERGDFRTTVVGGKNNEMFTVGGIAMPPKQSLEGGNYRIEISPAREKKDDVFLNAMYVTTNSANLPELKMIKEQGAGWVGVTVRDRMVTFSKEAVLLDNSLNITVRNNGFNEVSVLLTDIAEGKWQIKGNNGTEFVVESKKGENTLYFKCAPGAYAITKADLSASIKTFETAEYKFRKIGDFTLWRAAADATQIGHGTFIFQEKPSKVVDNVAYVCAEVLEEFGAQVTVSGNTATITAPGGKLVVTAGTTACTKDDVSATLTHTPFAENDTVYVALNDVASVVNYSFSYRPHVDMVFAKAVASE